MPTEVETGYDLELIFSLEVEDPVHCEGQRHALGICGHSDANDIFWFARITCGCGDARLTMCDGWIQYVLELREISMAHGAAADYLCLDCQELAILEVLGGA